MKNNDMYSALMDLYNDAGTYDDNPELLLKKKANIGGGVNIFATGKKSDDESGKQHGSDNDDEQFVFKQYSKPIRRNFTEKELSRMREDSAGSLVHDYSTNDIYHKTDEERMGDEKFHEISLKLAKLTTIYSTPSEYIKAMRVVVEAWKLAAEDNKLYSHDEFFDQIASGFITSSRIIIPKLRGYTRYNKDMLIKYISNPDVDATELDSQFSTGSELYAMQEDFKYDESIEDIIERMLSPEEVQILMTEESTPVYMDPIDEKYINSHSNSYTVFNKRYNGNRKKQSKLDRLKQDNLSKVFTAIENHRYRENGYVSSIDMFGKYERAETAFDRVSFEGSWSNKYDVKMYELRLNQELSKDLAPGEKNRRNQDVINDDFFRALEDAGMNVLQMRTNTSLDSYKMSRKESLKVKKENEKVERDLLERLTKLNNSNKFNKLVKKAEEQINIE